MAANRKIIPLRPRRALTLADLSVTWKDKSPETGREIERRVTGVQLAKLLTIAAEATPSDSSIGNASDEAGALIYKLRGLSVLIFPDAGTSIHEDDARAFVSDYLERAAAVVAADSLGDNHAKTYTVTIGGGA